MKESFANRPKYQNFVAHTRILRGGQGSGPPPPLKNHKNIGFLSNTGPDPLKIHKLPSQHSMLGHHQPVPVSETPFKWRFAGRPVMARFKYFLDGLTPHKKKKKKSQSLAKLSGSAHGGPRIVDED